MLKIINDLKPFFEENYRRINVREYARLAGISPPTASKLLDEYRKEGVLKKEEERQFFYYFANKENSLFIDLSRIYWKMQLSRIGLIDFFEKEFINPIIILFGSLSKAETKIDSDMDIAIFTATKKEINLKQFEKKINRTIQLFLFQKIEDVKNKDLLKNILNGCILKGYW